MTNENKFFREFDKKIETLKSFYNRIIFTIVVLVIVETGTLIWSMATYNADIRYIKQRLPDFMTKEYVETIKNNTQAIESLTKFYQDQRVKNERFENKLYRDSD